MSRSGHLAFVATLVCASSALADARLLIENDSPANVGFNDSTPATPVGGNPGTTLGQQRLYAFQYAASIWGTTLQSTVPILIAANFEPLACSATSAVLGSTAPMGHDTGASFPMANTWYASALANTLSGVDLDPSSADIQTQFNSDLGGANCLPGISFYLGLDGNHGQDQVDLVTVALHEFSTGLAS